MWYLVGQGRHAGLRVWLKPETTLTIGRLKAGDGDVSVGRRHLAITTGKPSMSSVSDRSYHTSLSVRDLNSKRGVLVNGKAIEAGKDFDIQIEENQTWAKVDTPHLAGRGYGGYANIEIGDKTSFRLERVDLSISSSGMTRDEKLRLIESAVDLDVKVESSGWIPGVSTHLVIGNNKLTEKLYLALAQGAYLVNTTWLKALEKCLEESWETKGAIFNPALETDYPAPVPQTFQDASLDWQPSVARTLLFEHHRFISLVEPKIKNIGQVVECAGGRWSIEDPASTGKVISECLSSTMIPVFLSPPGSERPSDKFPSVNAILKSRLLSPSWHRMKYRWVQEDEIGKAVIYATADTFCNPKYMDELPSHTSMSLMMGTMNSSHYMGSLAPSAISEQEGFSTLDESTISKGGTSKGLSHINEANDNSSFSLSQFMPRTNKKAALEKTISSTSAEVTAPSSPVADTTTKPAKKKTKVDRMAAFFDDDDDDMIISSSPIDKKPAIPSPTPITKTNSASIVDVPVPKAWPISIDLDSDHEENKIDKIKPEEIVKEKTEELSEKRIIAASGKEDFFDDDDEKEPQRSMPEDANLTRIESKSQASIVPSDMLSQASQLLKENAMSVRKKKPTAYDSVREDMIALNLDRKVGRQKETLEELERGRRLQAQRDESKKMELTTGVMQSERSEHLLAKNKRRKVVDEIPEGSQSNVPKAEGIQRRQEGSIQLNSSREQQEEKIKKEEEVSGSLMIMDNIKREDWPERWKALPNFKIRSSVSPILQEKWKNVPNFKTFRKVKKRAVLPGIQKAPGEPKPLLLDGELVVKQEETAKKIETYLKREEKDKPISGFSKALRPKMSEKKMAQNDLKMLLADD
ncbi:hypothetical protein BG004_007691 [Podila humilis]|nr:hypothetical protein BG004_007691 [Podila humilis]